MVHVVKSFWTAHGPQRYEFDFIPEEPTIAQLEGCLSHNCSTCRWKNLRHTSYCKAPNQPDNTHCDGWEIHVGCISSAEHEFFRRLHEEHYGKTCVPL